MPDLPAYLDPGSGSMLLQIILGGVAGLAVSLKMFGSRVFSFLQFWKWGRREAPARSDHDSG